MPFLHPKTQATHKPESFVQCPHLQLCQLFWPLHVSPTTAIPPLGLFNGIIVGGFAAACFLEPLWGCNDAPDANLLALPMQLMRF